MASESPRLLDTASKFALFSVSDLKDEKLIKKQAYMETETCKLYSGVFWIFLPNFIKIDLYSFQLYRFKVGAFFETQCRSTEECMYYFAVEITHSADLTIPALFTPAMYTLATPCWFVYSCIVHFRRFSIPVSASKLFHDLTTPQSKGCRVEPCTGQEYQYQEYQEYRPEKSSARPGLAR